MTATLLPQTMSTFAQSIFDHKYAFTPGETLEQAAYRMASHVVGPYFPDAVNDITQLIAERKFLPGGRYWYATGRKFHQTQNCLLLRVEDSREGWADLMRRVTQGLMTGAGIGVDYSLLRENGALIKGMGGTSTGPISVMNMVNEAGRHIVQGGSRRSAIWAGLNWRHPDVMDFIRAKDWPDYIREAKERDFNAVAPLDGTNISVLLDDEFFAAYNDPSHSLHVQAQEVYWTTVKRMVRTGEPGFSVDVGANAGETLRNACTEVTSADDNDICNLGSINLARIGSLDEMQRVVELGTMFLLCGTLYSKVPYEEVAVTREKNRRLGLGVMGFHEWLLTHGYKYGPNEELAGYLNVYAQSGNYARVYADELNISRPVKTRAIAPTGTIGIIAETTTGIEPVFCVALKRRYNKNGKWHFQYIVDATAQRIIDQGVDPGDIEDAYVLSENVERRLEFQAFVQQYVDHGISSTINLPAWGTRFNNEGTWVDFGNTLLKYLPHLRGITTYPDGARGGQPLNRVDYTEAINLVGTEFEEYGAENACVGGVCGI